MRLKPLNEYRKPFSEQPPTEAQRGFYNIRVNSAGRSRRIVVVGMLSLLWVACLTILFVLALRGLGGSQELAHASEAKVIIQKPAIAETVEVLVPVHDIQQNSALLPEDFIRVARPKLALSNGVITSYDELRNTYARTLIPANQPLVRDFVTKDQATNEVIANIPSGFRAVTISVNATTGVEGWARAGAKVDVQWIGDLRGQRVAKKLVENAKVLSAEREVDPHADPSDPIPTTVTLLVSDKDSQRIGLAQTAGSLVLLLRGANDVRAGNSDGTMTWGDLFGGSTNPNEKNIEGVVRVREKDGKYKEYAVVNGAVLQHKE